MLLRMNRTCQISNTVKIRMLECKIWEWFGSSSTKLFIVAISEPKVKITTMIWMPPLGDRTVYEKASTPIPFTSSPF